jgi:hypothetical protein
MPGASSLLLAEIGIPDAGQCLTVAAPILAIFALWWVVQRVDLMIDRLFPNLEWERRLGWLNIRAQRRAEAGLRWIGYFIYAVLAVALCGIVWSARGLGAIKDWSDPSALSPLGRCLPVLLVSGGVWLVYLGCALIPKVRSQHETEELEKFRAEQAELEAGVEASQPRRKKPVYPSQPRFDPPARFTRLGPKR